MNTHQPLLEHSGFKSINFGLDAPFVVVFQFFSAIALMIVGIVLTAATHSPGNMGIFVCGLLPLFVGIVMVVSSKRGKIRMAQEIVDSIFWIGNEQVLDVGCGHGLMLISAANKLRNGKCTGVDLWSSFDQASNRWTYKI